MTDADLIDALGGPTKLAALLRLSEKGGVQRVSNWKRRGIPPRMLLDHAQVFRDAPRGESTVDCEPKGAVGAPAVPEPVELRDAA